MIGLFPLRQSTASQEVLLGPFIDDTDGKTAETALTIANTDIKVWKSGGTSEASKTSGGATHIASGRYYAVLDATDTDTLGPLEINVHVSGALPVKLRCIVLTSNAYDSLVAGSDALQVDTIQITGTSQTARDVGANVDAAVSSRLASGSYTAPDNTSITAIKAKTDNLPASPAATSDVPSAASVAAAVWAAGTRTLTGFGTLAADVWQVATRTLSGFAFEVTASSVTDKTGYELTGDYDPAKTAAQAGDAMTLTSDYDAAKTAAQASDIPTPPTTAQIADKVLGRSIAGGTDGGRTVSDALRVSRNKVVRSGSTLTVYEEDDTTIAWTATITTDEDADAVTGVAPV